MNWSPEQIAGWLKRIYPDDEANRVSHETIYRSLFVQSRGVLKKELLGHLRSKRTVRRSKFADPKGDRRGQIKDLVSIRQRPAAVEDRAIPGQRWIRLVRQFGGLAKVDRVRFYAANCSVIAAIS